MTAADTRNLIFTRTKELVDSVEHWDRHIASLANSTTATKEAFDSCRVALDEALRKLDTHLYNHRKGDETYKQARHRVAPHLFDTDGRLK